MARPFVHMCVLLFSITEFFTPMRIFNLVKRVLIPADGQLTLGSKVCSRLLYKAATLSLLEFSGLVASLIHYPLHYKC